MRGHVLLGLLVQVRRVQQRLRGDAPNTQPQHSSEAKRKGVEPNIEARSTKSAALLDTSNLIIKYQNKDNQRGRMHGKEKDQGMEGGD